GNLHPSHSFVSLSYPGAGIHPLGERERRDSQVLRRPRPRRPTGAVMPKSSAERAVLLMLLLLVNGAAGVAPARWEGCDLRGPLSDFWPKVVRDWSRRIPGLNWGPAQAAM